MFCFGFLFVTSKLYWTVLFQWTRESAAAIHLLQVPYVTLLLSAKSVLSVSAKLILEVCV